ncbi:PAS domain-containing protein, partial [candidate division WOR-3 bacterium]|nr:PAS domain-containing protein [candidate division WOR-3 bacterium]
GLTTTPKKKITLFNVLTPSSLKIAMANVSKAALTGTTRPKPYELTVKRLDGTLVDVEVFIGLVQYEGKPHMLGTARDITERKRAYEMLQKSKEKYRLLSENVPAVVYSALPDEQSSNLFVSSKVEELTGYNAEQFLQSPELWDDIIHPEDREYVWQKIEEHRKKKIVLYVEYRIITKDKKIKWIKDTATPVFDNNGHIVRIDGFMEDITERKRVEESLKKKNEELERFNKFAVGRELKMIELKKKINELLLKMGKKPKYKIPERINTEINK